MTSAPHGGRLAGKAAIVTGAGQGLGLDIARRLHADGARVLLADLDGGAVQAAALALGERAMGLRTDVGSDDDIDGAIAAALERFGRLDILVNNACIYLDAGLDSSRADWHRTLDTNLISAAIFACKATAVMRAGAVVVNMGSTGGKFGAVGRALYPASKAGLLQLTRNIAASLAPRRIRCVSVSPAWTWSPAMQAMAEGDLDAADRVGARVHPLGRVGRGTEVAAAVAFACSDDASWITGADIPVDGGFSAVGPDQGRSPRSWFAGAA